jgi:hypothetical protein
VSAAASRLAALRRALAVGVWLLMAPGAAALVVDTPDQERTLERPEPDPGWAHVGRRGITSAVYLGHGWVLTSAHSGVGPVVLADGVHEALPETAVRPVHPGSDGASADLLLFRIAPVPDLPALVITERTPAFGDRLLLIGFGQGRGEPFEQDGVPGYLWSGAGRKRWGTNRVYAGRADIPGPDALTRCFGMDFSRHGTEHEAQAAVGDSGGAVFTRDGGRWTLAGVLVSVGSQPGQPRNSAIYGNITHAADLSFYRPQILRIMGRGGASGAHPGGS